MSLSNDSNMVMPVTPAYGMGYNNGNGMFGGDWFAWIILLLLFGGGRWGNNNCDNASNVLPYLIASNNNGGSCCCAPATCADLQRGFDNQSVMNKLNGLENGLCSLGYDQLNQMNGVNTNILNGFNGVDNAVCQLGYQTQAAINGIGTQLQQCCCDTREAIQGVNYNTLQNFSNLNSKIDSCCCETQRQIERGFCDTNYNLATNTTSIIQNAHNDTDRVIAKLDAMEMARKDETISELRSQVNALNLAQSQANQNTYLINTLRPCPQPAYISCNPWAGSGYGGCGTYSSCGCGC